MEMFEDAFFIAPFLVSSSHGTFVAENRRFGGGSIVEPIERGCTEKYNRKVGARPEARADKPWPGLMPGGTHGNNLHVGKGGVRRHGGVRAVPYIMRGASWQRGYRAQHLQQQRNQEIRACDLIPSYHAGGCRAAGLWTKRSLTLVRPCVRCCAALWAWCCTAGRLVRAAKAPRSAFLFQKKRGGSLWQQSFFCERCAPYIFFVTFFRSPSQIGSFLEEFLGDFYSQLTTTEHLFSKFYVGESSSITPNCYLFVCLCSFVRGTLAFLVL